MVDLVRFCVLYVYSIVVFRVCILVSAQGIVGRVINARYYYYYYYYYYNKIVSSTLVKPSFCRILQDYLSQSLQALNVQQHHYGPVPVSVSLVLFQVFVGQFHTY